MTSSTISRPTVATQTLGCKVSQYESEAIAEAFVARGYALCSFADACDVYVINTCTVTAESDRKSRQMIRRAIKNNPSAIVCVCGCYSQTSADEVAAISGVSIVIGTKDKLTLPDLVEAVKERRRTGDFSVLVRNETLEGATFEKMCITHAPRTRAYVKIEDGCECRCTYCAIPGARGPVRSKAPEDVISEVEGLYRSGVREVVLTGIETASYGADFRNGYRLGDLLSELDRRGSAERIRLGSLTPELMTEDFVEKIRSLPLLVPHFHLSMQSGSDGVLRRMKRRYNIKMAREALVRLREAIPRVEFTTDLMVGFPGESEEEFEETLAFVREARFLDIHVFAYSRRPNTPAATYEGQVPEEVKRERSAKLIALKNQIRDEILDDYIREGKTLSVVLEKRWDDGSYSSHSDSFVEVRVKVPTDRGDLHGEIVSATPVSHRDGVIIAELNKM